VIEKAEKTHANLLDEIRQLTAEQEELQRHISLAADAKVVAGRMAHAGVRILIGNRTFEIDDDQEGVAFSLREGEIKRELLPRTGARVVMK
jgi:uncharacterized protein (DUF342 family)